MVLFSECIGLELLILGDYPRFKLIDTLGDKLLRIPELFKLPLGDESSWDYYVSTRSLSSIKSSYEFNKSWSKGISCSLNFLIFLRFVLYLTISEADP